MTEKSEARMDYYTVAPAAIEPLLKMEQYVRSSGLEPALLELVKLRASMINGCAYCVDMHTKDARTEGESEQRLYAVSVWHEAPFFTPRERAALAWTDSLTSIGTERVPDEIYNLAREHFSERELVDLTMAVIAINGWNRLAIAFRAQAGTYEPGQFKRKTRGQAT